MAISNFEKNIQPFFWVQYENGASVCLNVGEYKNELFESRADEGFEGGGYDWESLARVFIEEIRGDLADYIEFDSEASMFCAYSSNWDALRMFVLSFKQACEDDDLIKDLFSRAELD